MTPLVEILLDFFFPPKIRNAVTNRIKPVKMNEKWIAVNPLFAL